MKARHTAIIFLLLFLSSFTLSAQVVEDEKPLTKKEFRAKRKKAKALQKVNQIHEVRRNAKELLETRDFVLKDDGRSGSSGVVSFFKIHGDTVTIQTWSNGQVGTSLDYRRGANKVIGDILTYEIQDNGLDKPLQVFIWYRERVRFSQQLVSVYVYGNRVEAAGIRGYFSSVADANIFVSGVRSTGKGPLISRARRFDAVNRERGGR